MRVRTAEGVSKLLGALILAHGVLPFAMCWWHAAAAPSPPSVSSRSDASPSASSTPTDGWPVLSSPEEEVGGGPSF